MIRDSAAMLDGFGIPFVKDLSNDHQRIIVRVLVSEKDLPRNYEERKYALLVKATSAVGTVGRAFELSFEDKSATHAVKVEFVSIQELVKATDPKQAKTYAEFQDGELTSH